MEEKTDYIGDLNDDEISEVLDKAMSEEERIWDEFAREYSGLQSLDLEQVRHWFIPLLQFGKQHYTLTKK